MIRLPDEPTTPEQWQVIAWAGILSLLVLGGLAFYFSFQVPETKHALVRSIRHLSLSFVALAVTIYAAMRTITHFLA